MSYIDNIYSERLMFPDLEMQTTKIGDDYNIKNEVNLYLKKYLELKAEKQKNANDLILKLREYNLLDNEILVILENIKKVSSAIKKITDGLNDNVNNINNEINVNNQINENLNNEIKEINEIKELNQDYNEQMDNHINEIYEKRLDIVLNKEKKDNIKTEGIV